MTLTGLTDGSDYSASVTAVNQYGAGPAVTSAGFAPTAVRGKPSYLRMVLAALSASDALQNGQADSVDSALASSPYRTNVAAWISDEADRDLKISSALSQSQQQIINDSVTLRAPLVVGSADGTSVSVFAQAYEQFTTLDTSTGVTHAVPGAALTPIAYTFSLSSGAPVLTATADEDALVNPVTANAVDSTIQSSSLDTPLPTNLPAPAQEHGPDVATASTLVSPATTTRNANLSGVVSWALANWNKATPSPINDDCTDFASWALHSGGDLRFQTYYYVHDLTLANDHDWFMSDYVEKQWSRSWSFAVHNFDWQVYQNAVFMPYWNAASPGDLIWANWSGGPASGISHMGVITAAYGTNLYITQHTNDRKNEPLWKVAGTTTWQGTNPSVAVWIDRPSQQLP